MFLLIVSISVACILATHVGAIGANPSTVACVKADSCATALKPGDPAGIHELYMPNTGLDPFFVYCLPDPIFNGSAWTVIQRRIDGAFNFTRDWRDYKNGFGNLESEFFIGLQRLHVLTTYRLHELWIQMEDFAGCTAYAKYTTFAVDNEMSHYTMNVLGKYYGTAGDSMRNHEGMKFTTIDSDNDQNIGDNCAMLYHGGYWYNNCLHNNLNGLYHQADKKTTSWGQGISWLYFGGLASSLKSVHMAIRPVPC